MKVSYLVAGLAAVAATGAMMTAGAGAASAATPTSVARSQSFNVGPLLITGALKEMCPTGYHVRGRTTRSVDGIYNFEPAVKVSGDWITQLSDSVTPVAPYLNGVPVRNEENRPDYTYGGFTVRLHNWSLMSVHQATISWVCDKN